MHRDLELACAVRHHLSAESRQLHLCPFDGLAVLVEDDACNLGGLFELTSIWAVWPLVTLPRMPSDGYL